MRNFLLFLIKMIDRITTRQIEIEFHVDGHEEDVQIVLTADEPEHEFRLQIEVIHADSGDHMSIDVPVSVMWSR